MKFIEKLHSHLQKELHLWVSLRIALSLFLWCIPFFIECLKSFGTTESEMSFLPISVFYIPFGIWHSLSIPIADFLESLHILNSFTAVCILVFCGMIHISAFVLTVLFWCKARVCYLYGLIIILLISAMCMHSSLERLCSA